MSAEHPIMICTELYDFDSFSIDQIGGENDREITLLSACKWDKSTLTVRFLDGEQVVKDRVKKYANEWSKYANVKFVFVDSGPADIRISFKLDGSWSYVGKCINSSLTQDEATMNYGWLTPETPDDEYARVVLHEFGHALGFVHEHQHPYSPIPWNVQVVYDYYWRTLMWDKEEVDRNIIDKYSAQVTNFSDFDPDSIMIYAIPNDVTIGNYETTWNKKLSRLDKEFVSRWYPYYITSRSSGDYSGKLLAVDHTSGSLMMVNNRTHNGAGWRIIKDNDIVRFQSVGDGAYFGQYLDVSTTSGVVKMHNDPSHSGTKWRIVNEGGYPKIISASSGKYNGKRLTVNTTKGTIWMKGAASHTGTRWQIA